MNEDAPSGRGLRGKEWRESYSTSSILPDARPVDILHDFYIPALRRAVKYDRVAGYFRSSSLAAASQGFSAFVGRQGKMRLIAGADFDPDDVEAILRGDQQRYTERLNHRLGEPGAWPDDVARGVELLCWMVAQGYLEVQVAFRVHAHTNEAVEFDSTADGYAHEKWAIFEDEDGNRLLATGSFNESRHALVCNAENLDVHCDWWGERERRRIENAKISFDHLWRDRHPYFRVMPLPEAVRKRLVRIGDAVDFPTEIDGTSAVARNVAPPSPLERLKFALLRDGPHLPGGRFVGMTTAPVEPWPHQSIVARRLIASWPYSHLLCDEVGLGKTIEAGLAVRSLYLSGLVKRVLIAPPASLKKQWQREMASKFLLSFAHTETSPTLEHHYIYPQKDLVTSDSVYSPDLNIVSSAIVGRRDRSSDIDRAKAFDIVLIDEAHACRRKNPTDGVQGFPDYTYLYQNVRDHLLDKTKSLWLATATPMQLEKIEAWDLLKLTQRAGAFLFDPSLTFQYYDYLGQLMRDERLRDEAWQLLRSAINAVEQQNPVVWTFIKTAVIDARIQHAAERWLKDGEKPRGYDRTLIRRLIFAASPLSRVMMRHTRSLLEIYRDRGELQKNLAHREILPIPRITFTPEEERAYNGLEAYCSELAAQINRHADEQTRHQVGFYKSFLRLRFASSFYAITETIRRRKKKVLDTLAYLEAGTATSISPAIGDYESLVMDPEAEDAREVEETVLKNRTPEDLRWEAQKLEDLLEVLERLHGPSSKMLELLKALDKRRDTASGRIEQTVVFTRFYDTLTEIVRQLRNRDPHLLIGTYSGQGGQYTHPRTRELLNVDREDVKHLFLRNKIDVLVCTDAAAEGLNLQTANLIINYDLPWNPMKVEQRIGRLDRIGQKHDRVDVLNLCYLGSSEEIVYGRLLRRLREAGSIVGTQQMSMLPVIPDEFRQLAEGEIDQQELEKRASQRAEEQQERTKSMEIPPEDLYDIYQRLQRDRGGIPSPVDLLAIWSALSESRYLQALGCRTSDDVEEPVFVACGINNVPEKTRLTTSRQLFEEGLPEEDVKLHFASYGDPYFDAILDEFEQHDLPPSIRRLSLRLRDLPTEIVGYAVACAGPGDTPRVELVTRWQDLENLQILEDGEVSEQALNTLRSKLRAQAREAFSVTRTARRIERENLRAGYAQIAFAYLLAPGLLKLGADDLSKTNFSRVANHLETRIDREKNISVPGIPVDPLQRVGDKLLFHPTIPSLGAETTLYATLPMLRSALDAAYREADGMKRRKSEILIHAVIDRLVRRLEASVRALEEA